MTLPGRNRFPRGSTEPTTSPAAQSAAKASGWRIGLHGTDELAGESTNNKPTCRGMEANTDDGRASRQPTFSHQDTSTGDLGKDVTELDAGNTGDTGTFGETTRGPGTQGGISGASGGNTETFDD